MANPLVIATSSWGYIEKFNDPAEYNKVVIGNPYASLGDALTDSVIGSDWAIPVDARSLVSVELAFTIVTAPDAGFPIAVTYYDADVLGTFAAETAETTHGNIIGGDSPCDNITSADGTGLVTRAIAGDALILIADKLPTGGNIVLGFAQVGASATSQLVMSRVAGMTLTLTFNAMPNRAAHYARLRND